MQHFTQQKYFALQLFTQCFTILSSVFINIISDLNLKTTTFFWQAKIISVFINLGAFKLLWPRFSVYQSVMPARTRTWHCMVGTEHQSYTCVFQIRLHGITEVPQRLKTRKSSLSLSKHTFIYFTLQASVNILCLKKEFGYLFLNLKTPSLQHADQNFTPISSNRNIHSCP